MKSVDEIVSEENRRAARRRTHAAAVAAGKKAYLTRRQNIERKLAEQAGKEQNES